MQLCRWHHDGLIDAASPPTLSQHSFIGVYDGHGGDQAACSRMQLQPIRCCCAAGRFIYKSKFAQKID